MASERIDEMARKLTEIGGLFNYGPEHSRLLIQVWRALATGQPVTGTQIDGFVLNIGIGPEDADQFLRQMTERDADDSIIGIMGLSMNDHPHKFTVGGVEMAAWCAADTLFLPVMLGQTATVESESPLSKETVQVTASPEGVQASDPADAVITIVVPEETDMSSVASISMTFCHHIFFFASVDGGQRWAADRDNIAIHPVEDAYQFVTAMWRKVRAYANQDPLPGKDQSR